MSRANLVTLLSDFGLRDSYVAQMKAVILSLNPQARLVDITHEIGAGSIREAVFALESAYRLFPAGSVHLAVVDPGVGTARAPLAIEAAGYHFVGPDNGLFSLVLAAEPEARRIRLREDFREVSATFHGRDVFAPAAALLAAGRPLEELGERLEELVRLPLPEVRREAKALLGAVWHVDRFGNLITNLRPEHLEGRRLVRVRAGSWSGAPIGRTYSDVGRGECLALWGSSGYLEIACNRASAAARLGLAVGDAAEVETA